jgi:hypothetical protein
MRREPSVSENVRAHRREVTDRHPPAARAKPPGAGTPWTALRIDPVLWGWVIGLTAVTVLYRLIPYYLPSAQGKYAWNLVPVGALALFAGSRLRSPYAYLVPLAAMFLSDLLLIRPLAAMGMSAFSAGTPVLYASFVLYVAIGRLLGRDERSPFVLGGAALLGGAQFFLVSNFLVWLGGGGLGFPRTLGGLGQTYLAAIPFYRNTAAGDLIFTGLFFGLHAVAEKLRAYLAARQPA